MKPWIAGLIATVSGGVSGVIGPVVTDPDHFVTGMGALQRLGIAAGITAVTHLFAYLARSPLPGVKPENGANGKS